MFSLASLRKNLTLKIFSVLIAIVWWAVVHGEDTHIKDYEVPVDYANLPASVMLAGRVVDTVTVRLRASDAILRGLSEDRLAVRVDLAGAPLGEQRIPMTTEMLRRPAGTEVVRIAPAQVPVRIERKVRRQVPVVAEFTGRPAKGYVKVGHSIEPPTATLEGPASEVSQVSRALAGTVFLEGETGTIDFVTHPTADAPGGSHVRIVAPAAGVRVRVTIAPEDEAPAAGDDAARARPAARPRKKTG